MKKTGMTDKELLHAVNIADAAMMTVVKELYERNDDRAGMNASAQADFCARLQHELGGEGEMVSCSTVGAAEELLEALENALDRIEEYDDPNLGEMRAAIAKAKVIS